MSKVSIETILKNNNGIFQYKGQAIFIDEILKYKDADDSHITYNYKNNEFIRETNELRLYYKFKENKKTNGEIYIKSLDRNMILEINTKKIIRKKNYIEIEFSVEGDNIKYSIEVKE